MPVNDQLDEVGSIQHVVTTLISQLKPSSDLIKLFAYLQQFLCEVLAYESVLGTV